jgi:hypothetical protein
MRKYLYFILLSLALLLLIFLALVLWDYFTVDRCLDRGGKWNSIESRCIGIVE